MTCRLTVIFLFGAIAWSQTRPPVVLLNGYQGKCVSGATSEQTFGQLQTKLSREGLAVYFFDNCAVKGTGARPTIEELGQAFGQFLDTIAAPQVDVVAHSMGGLIVRAYLAGMLPSGQFAPLPAGRIRKAVFIGVPNYGALALMYLLIGSSPDIQMQELLPGSSFEWTLNTSNQGSYDFRGADVLSIAGNGAPPGQSDGAVPLTSASLAGFLGPDRVRVIAGCHVRNLPSFICSGPGIAYVDSDSHPGFRIIDSFLADTPAWQSIGNAADQDPVLSTYGGLNVVFEDANGVISKSIVKVAAPEGELAGDATSGVFFADLFTSRPYQISASGGGPGVPSSFTFLPSIGYDVPVVVKNGPFIAAVASATGPLASLSRAPDMLVSLYGAHLAGASVTVAGQAVTMLYSSDTQLNAVLPSGISGVVPLAVANESGSYPVNLFIEPSVPALFSMDAAGSGLAAHADGSLVSASNPAAPGETISVYGTGMRHATDLTATVDGLQTGSVSVAAASPGVDTVLLVLPAQLPSGASAALTLSAGGHTSNTVVLNIE